jgi:hypothetical protein
MSGTETGRPKSLYRDSRKEAAQNRPRIIWLAGKLRIHGFPFVPQLEIGCLNKESLHVTGQTQRRLYICLPILYTFQQDLPDTSEFPTQNVRNLKDHGSCSYI